VTRCNEARMGKEICNRFRKIQEIRKARQFTYAGMAITDWDELEEKVYEKIDLWNSDGPSTVNLNPSILPDPLKDKFYLLFAAMDRVGQATPVQGDFGILDKYDISYSPIDDGYHIGHPVSLSYEDLNGDGTNEIIFRKEMLRQGNIGYRPICFEKISRTFFPWGRSSWGKIETSFTLNWRTSPETV
jgi:hypothetical protein